MVLNVLILKCTNLKRSDETCDRDRISALLIRYCYSIKILVSISHTISHTATKFIMFVSIDDDMIYINMHTEKVV